MRPIDRRREPRLRYSWDTHIYTDGFRSGYVGRMVDLNSRSAALLVDFSADLWPGKEIEVGFMYPKVVNGNFDIIQEHRKGTVIRDNWHNPQLKRVVIEFHETLPESPAIGNEYTS